MIHIGFDALPDKAKVFLNSDPSCMFPLTVCGKLEFGDALTETAMESNCDECRVKLLIQPVVRDKQGNPKNVATASTYDPKPMV